MCQQPLDCELQTTFAQLGFVTVTPSVVDLLRRAYKAALVSDITVLLEGETGTGKQVLAHGIHQLDRKRNSAAFVTAHCSTISEGLAESELFGHRRGAFSGAVSSRKGLFQAAAGGTLFLDDVNDLPLHLQPKLLDVIQRGIARPVGSDHEVRVDVRIIAACNRPLEPLVREGRFRPDLYYRLNVVKFSLPPLRERLSDLPDLVLALAHRHRSLYEPIDAVEPGLVNLLQSQPFFGNVRELENTVQRMLFLKTQGASLGLADWIAQAGPAAEQAGTDPLAKAAGDLWTAISQDGIPYARAVREIERRVLETAINVPGTTRRVAAQRLGTSERTLYNKMRVHGIRSARES
jgi:transcriptional regulator with GAF, ATPase, and Fis domain